MGFFGFVCLGLALAAAPGAADDFDKDGIPDLEDDCPTDPGTAAGKGCPGDLDLALPPPSTEPAPQVTVSGDRIDLSETVHFRSGSASVDPKSYALVAALAKVIAELPAGKRVSVEGHTDDRGARAANQRLSEQRAQGLIAHLVRAGVPRERLSAAGSGEDRPLVPNTSAEGRARNRRVELIIHEDAR